MISVSLLRSQPLSFVQVSGLTGQLVGNPSSPSWQYGGHLFAIPVSDGEVDCYRENLPFGWLIQGKQPHGKLREKDVQHLNAKGSIVVDGVTAVSPRPSGETRAFHHGWDVSTHAGSGDRSYLIADMVIWGTDSWNYHTFVAPRLFSTAIGKWQLPFSFGVETAVRFDGEYAAVLYRVEPHDTVYEDSDITTHHSGWCTVQFLRLHGRWPDGYRAVWTSDTFQGSSQGDPRGFFIFPSGRHVRYDDVVAVPSKYDVMLPQVLETLLVPTSTNPGGSMATFDAIVNSITRSALAGYVWETFDINRPDFDHGVLGHDILAQQNYVDSNILLTVFELSQLLAGDWKSFQTLGETVKGLWTSKDVVLKEATRLGKFLKTWLQTGSTAILTWQYGVMPTARDASATFAGLGKLCKFALTYNRYHARRSTTEKGGLGSPIQSTHVLTVEADPLPRDFQDLVRDPLGYAMGFIENQHKWGLWPTFAMVWDIIPFSFVVDMATNVGSLVEAMDDRIWTQYFNVHVCISSTKRLWSPSPERLWPHLDGVTGAVKFSHYDRYSSEVMPLPPLKLGETQPIGDRWIELTALVVQKNAR